MSIDTERALLRYEAAIADVVEVLGALKAVQKSYTGTGLRRCEGVLPYRDIIIMLEDSLDEAKSVVACAEKEYILLKRRSKTIATPEMVAMEAFRAYKPTAKEIRWAILLCGGGVLTPESRHRFLEVVPCVSSFYTFIKEIQLTFTPELVNMFVAANPTAWQIYLLMRDCEFARTVAILGHFLAGNPTAWQIYLLMRDCEFARTPEMLGRFVAANPTPEEAQWMIEVFGEFARTPEIIAIASADY